MSNELSIPHSDSTKLITGFEFPSEKAPFFAVHLHDNENSLLVKVSDAQNPQIAFQQGRGFRRLNHLELNRRKHPFLQFFALPIPIAGSGDPLHTSSRPVAILLFEPSTGVVHEIGTTLTPYALIAAGQFESADKANAECSRLAAAAYQWVEQVNSIWGHFASRIITDVAWIAGKNLQVAFDELSIGHKSGQKGRFMFDVGINDGYFDYVDSLQPIMHWTGTPDCFPRLNAFYCDFGASPALVGKSSTENQPSWSKEQLGHYSGNKLFVPVGLCLTWPDDTRPAGLAALIHLGTTCSPYSSNKSPDECAILASKAINVANEFNRSFRKTKPTVTPKLTVSSLSPKAYAASSQQGKADEKSKRK